MEGGQEGPRDWLLQFPDRVLFGTDAASFGPETGWELAAWIGTAQTRTALALALGSMVRRGEVSLSRARELAVMVMRTNAGALYGLSLGAEGVLREPAGAPGAPAWVEPPAGARP